MQKILTTSLGCDRVGAAGRVADAENLDIITEFTESGGCGRTAEACADNDNVELSLIGRADYTDCGFMVCPFFSQRLWKLTYPP